MRALLTVLIGVSFALLASTVALGKTINFTLIDANGQGATPPGFARTADGVLHVVYETNTNWGNSANGVGTRVISASGQLGAPVQALSWNGITPGSPNGIPGLAIMPGGALEAAFGGSPSSDDGPWGISSADGGSTWTSPADIGSGSMEFGDSAVRVEVSNGTPVLAAGCCGGIVIQQGFGPGSNTYLLTNSSDGSAGNTDTAVDAASGAVVASWDSNDGAGGRWLQQVAPGSPGTAQQVPMPSQYGTGEPLPIAGRDTGPGVFAAYPADYGTTSHIRLLRYGGGSVAVGSVKGLLSNTWGAATGRDGRIWVFWWGQINGKGVLAVTRSNTSVTRFEPVQQYSSNWTFQFGVYGDGRLGPLDLLSSGTPPAPLGQKLVGGLYWARVLPELSASIKRQGRKLRIKVTDAGDPISGATVTVHGHKKKTNKNGVVKFKLHGALRGHLKVKVAAEGFYSMHKRIKL